MAAELLLAYHRLNVGLRDGEYSTLEADVWDAVDGGPLDTESTARAATIHRVSRELLRLAKQFEKAHRDHEFLFESSSTESLEQDPDVPEAIQVPDTFVKKIIQRFSGCITRETFRSALLSMSDYVTTLPLEFALGLELASQLMSTHGAEGQMSFIPDVINECFRSRISVEELQRVLRTDSR